MTGQIVNYVKETYDVRQWKSGALLIVAIFCVASFLLYAGIGPAILAWALLGLGVVLSCSLCATPLEVLIESGLLTLFRRMPLFDNNVLQEARTAALRSEVPFWGKRYVLMQRSKVDP